MKNKIPFNLFGEEQHLCFTIAGIVELERTLGKSIKQIVHSQDAGLNFCMVTLPICLKRLNPHLYLEKIEKYLDEEGNDIDDVATLIIHAIAASGALGKTIKENALRIYYPDLYPEPVKQEETEEKNG